MMEAGRTSETLVNFYQTTRSYNPEDSHLRTHRRENLKSHLGNGQTAIFICENTEDNYNIFAEFDASEFSFSFAVRLSVLFPTF
jgi:hypothetical protein